MSEKEYLPRLLEWKLLKNGCVLYSDTTDLALAYFSIKWHNTLRLKFDLFVYSFHNGLNTCLSTARLQDSIFRQAAKRLQTNDFPQEFEAHE